MAGSVNTVIPYPLHTHCFPGGFTGGEDLIFLTHCVVYVWFENKKGGGLNSHVVLELDSRAVGSRTGLPASRI